MTALITYAEFACKQIVPQLLSFPICKAWARYIPNVTLFGLDVNPGPFTIKEHVIVTIMAGVGAQSAYAVRTESKTKSVDSEQGCFSRHV
jgi:OPT oligopeptide transporter protein